MVDIQSSTPAKMARIKEFQDTEHVPDLGKKVIGVIEEAGSKLHQRIFMWHICNGQGLKPEPTCYQTLVDR